MQPKENLEIAKTWYLVHTHSGREQVVVNHLERQGFVCFLPTFIKAIKIGRKSRMVKAAYFPAYVFVSFDRYKQNWRPINGTIGVKRLVCSDDTPAMVPAGVMTALLARADLDGNFSITPTLTTGDIVRIADGPFTGMIAKIEALPSQARARLLLDIMSQMTPIEINQTSLELV